MCVVIGVALQAEYHAVGEQPVCVPGVAVRNALIPGAMAACQGSLSGSGGHAHMFDTKVAHVSFDIILSTLSGFTM